MSFIQIMRQKEFSKIAKQKKEINFLSINVKCYNFSLMYMLSIDLFFYWEGV